MYLQKTIDSVVAQTLRPAKWVIVNDGSTDNTQQIIDEAAKQHGWIQAVHRPDRGFRSPGGGVVETFYDGFRLADGEPWDYLVKLDGDLSFAPDYFAACLARFDAEPKLGIGGGTICGAVNGVLVEESQGDPAFHVRGATKIYRQACWQAIGGLLRAPGWDTVDEFKANMLGWVTYTFPEIQLLQHRPTGQAQGDWKNWVKNGRANYIAGYHPLFMLVKCVSRLKSRPYGLAALGLLKGYLDGCLGKVPIVGDERLVRYVRQQQIRRLLQRECLWTQKLARPSARPGGALAQPPLSR